MLLKISPKPILHPTSKCSENTGARMGIWKPCSSISWFYHWGNQDPEILSDLPEISWKTKPVSAFQYSSLLPWPKQGRLLMTKAKSRNKGWVCWPADSLQGNSADNTRTYAVRTDRLQQQFPWPDNRPQDSVKCKLYPLEKLRKCYTQTKGLHTLSEQGNWCHKIDDIRRGLIVEHPTFRIIR